MQISRRVRSQQWARTVVTAVTVPVKHTYSSAVTRVRVTAVKIIALLALLFIALLWIHSFKSYTIFIANDAIVNNVSPKAIGAELELPNASVNDELDRLDLEWNHLFWDVWNGRAQCDDNTLLHQLKEDLVSIQLFNRNHPTMVSTRQIQRALTSLRRRMLSVTQICGGRRYSDLQSNSLLPIFANISKEYTIETIFQMHNKSKDKITYFNIHVSKSAGTSITSMIKRIGLKTPVSLGDNLNLVGLEWLYRGHDSGKDDTYFDCNRLLQLSNHSQFVAAETPVSQSMLNCDDFLYIMSVRHPFERDLSWFGYIFFETPFYRETGLRQLQLEKIQADNDLFRGFIDELLSPPLQRIVRQKRGNATFESFENSTLYQMIKPGKKCLRCLNSFRNHFMNIYTRWIGCNHNLTQFDLFECLLHTKQSQLSIDVNLKLAVSNLFRIEFVLPFSSFLEPRFGISDGDTSELWDIFAQALQRRKHGRLVNITMPHINVAKKKINESIWMSSTQRFWQLTTEAERQLFQSVNFMDYCLWNISKMIAISDILFYQFLFQ